MDCSPVHVGSLVHQELANQNRSVSWLAEQLGLQRPNCYRLLRTKSMNTERLYRVSEVLKHDFFADYSKVFIQNRN